MCTVKGKVSFAAAFSVQQRLLQSAIILYSEYLTIAPGASLKHEVLAVHWVASHLLQLLQKAGLVKTFEGDTGMQETNV